MLRTAVFLIPTALFITSCGGTSTTTSATHQTAPHPSCTELRATDCFAPGDHRLCASEDGLDHVYYCPVGKNYFMSRMSEENPSRLFAGRYKRYTGALPLLATTENFAASTIKWQTNTQQGTTALLAARNNGTDQKPLWVRDYIGLPDDGSLRELSVTGDSFWIIWADFWQERRSSDLPEFPFLMYPKNQYYYALCPSPCRFPR